MNINTSTNEFEPVRTEVNAVPVESLPSAEHSATETGSVNVPQASASPILTENVKPDEVKEPEIAINQAQFGVGFPYVPEEGGSDIRVMANKAKLNGEELPLAV